MNPFLRKLGKTPDSRFETLVRPHLDRLYRLAYRLTGSSMGAEDLVQDLLVRLIPRESRLAETEQLAPWLARSLLNLYLNQQRRPASVVPMSGLSDGEADVVAQIIDEVSEPPDRAAERLLSQERILAALEQLPPEQRALIGWHDIEGYTLEELAGEKDIPVGTLKSRLHRARARLRQLLGESGTAASHPRVRLVRVQS